MKKVIATVISLILIISSCTNVFAMKAIPATYQDRYIDTKDMVKIEPEETSKYKNVSVYSIVSEIMGKKYISRKYGSPYYTPTKYDEELESIFPLEEYVITDDGYFTRDITNDGAYLYEHRYAVANYIRLYDKNFNLIKTHILGYVTEIEYVDGLYYAVSGSTAYVSSDFEEWAEIKASDIPRKNSECVINNKTVKFKGSENFVNIIYEDGLELKYNSMFGDWFIQSDKNNELYLTKDNVYFVKIDYDEQTHRQLFDVVYCHNIEDSIILESFSEDRLVVPEYELYNALNELEEVPYVRLNGKILGFSQPPVMESDRILVPMRFLFEQMGATVDWNNDTQSAIATIDEEGQEKRVEFSIDNTTAFVNGKSETMDVPARLINDQTFVPLRFLSENLGYNVEWDNDARTAVITTE